MGYEDEMYEYHDDLHQRRMNKEQTIDTTEYKYTLLVGEGAYFAQSLWGLFTEVITHRWFHFTEGEGWTD